MPDSQHDPRNPFADLPLHQLLFLKLRDGGGAANVAPAVAELHGITIDELKAHCRRAGEEILAERALLVYEVPVVEWARS